VKVRVEEHLCQGHTLCQIAASPVLKLRLEDGHAYVEDDNVPEGMEGAVRLAAASCPENAISLIEEDGR
jgi:ferredoxin